MLVWEYFSGILSKQTKQNRTQRQMIQLLYNAISNGFLCNVLSISIGNVTVRKTTKELKTVCSALHKMQK